MDSQSYNSVLIPMSETNRTKGILHGTRVLTYKNRLLALANRIPFVQFNLGLGILSSSSKSSLCSFAMTATLIRFLAVLMLIFSSTANAADNIKIAVVDIQYVLDHSIAVTHLRESIDKLSEKLHKEMSAKEAELKNTEAELVKKRGVLGQERFDTEVNNFYKKVSEAQHDMQQKKAKLEQAHADAIGIVHDSTLKIVSDLAKEKGFNIALPISQILYTDDSLSITAEVVTRLNHSVKSIPLNYK